MLHADDAVGSVYLTAEFDMICAMASDIVMVLSRNIT